MGDRSNSMIASMPERGKLQSAVRFGHSSLHHIAAYRSSDPLVLASSERKEEDHEQRRAYKSDPSEGESGVHLATGALHCLLNNPYDAQVGSFEHQPRVTELNKLTDSRSRGRIHLAREHCPADSGFGRLSEHPEFRG